MRVLMALVMMQASIAVAQTVPGTVSFSARLADMGTPVQGSKTFIFKLYPTVAGGTEAWTETQTLTVTDGNVSAELGASMPLSESILSGAKLFLEVTVDGTVLTPRTPVVSVPYAIRTGVAARVGSLGEADIQKRVSSACPDGSSIRSIDAQGNVICQVASVTVGADGGSNSITGVFGQGGLTGGGTVGDINLAVAFGGSGSSSLVCRSDHDHLGLYLPLGPSLSCSGTDKVSSINPLTGAVTCTPDLNPSASAPLSNSGGVIQLSGIIDLLHGGTGSSTQNFIDLTTNQSIAGTKTFQSPIAGSITGNAATVTNGVYSSVTYNDPPWLGSLSGAKISGGISGNAGSVTNGLYSSVTYNDPPWLGSLGGAKVSGNIPGNAVGFTGGLSGDVTGNQSSTVVVALQGRSVFNAPPTGGQVLAWDAINSRWAPTAPSGGGVTQVNTGTGLTGGPITASGTVSIDTTVVPRLGVPNTFTFGGQLIQTGNPGLPGLFLRGAPGQAVNLQEWQNSSGTLLSSITNLGAFTGNAASATALSSNPANCPAGAAAGGVAANGSAESCIFVSPIARLIATNATLTGGGDLSADRTLGLNLGNANTWTAAQSFSGGLTGALAGNASTASALATDPANCAAGSAAGGITASGAAEACVSVIPASRAIATDATLTGGGDLSADRTLGLNLATANTWTTAQTFSGGLTGNLTGNATTSSGLNADPANCPAGSVAAGITASGAGEGCVAVSPSAQPQLPRDNTVTAVDPNAGSYPSITTGADGLPVISYYSSAVLHPRVVKCGNASCSAGNVINLIDIGSNLGDHSAIIVGADGFPVIAYRDITGGNLRVFKCTNAACGNLAASIQVNSGSGQYNSIAIGRDGFPIISTYAPGTADLRVIKCSNPSCSLSSTAVVDTAGNVGQGTSITVGFDGLPIIAYFDVTSNALKIVHCGDAACTAGNTFNTTGISTGGNSPSLVIGADGMPIIAYYDAFSVGLTFVRCADVSCTSLGPLRALDLALATSGGRYPSMTVGLDGRPVISYQDAQTLNKGRLKVVKCGTADCSANNVITTLESTANDLGWYTSITIGADGLPIIAHYDATAQDLRVVKCANPYCVPYLSRR